MNNDANNALQSIIVSAGGVSLDLYQIITIGIYVIAGLLVLVGLLMGLIRGFRRQLVRTITVAGSAVLAFFATGWLRDYAISEIEGKTLGEIMGGLLSDSWISTIGSETLIQMISLPLGLIVLPLVFVLAFIVISAVILIVHKILCGILGFTRRANTKLTRILGMIVGAAQGAFVALLLLMPISGILGMASDAVDILEDDYDGNESIEIVVEMYDDYVRDVTEHPVFVASSTVYGQLYYQLTSVSVDGKEVKMADSFDDLAVLCAEAVGFAEIDWANLSDENKDSLDNVVDICAGDEYIAAFVSGGLSVIGEMAKEENLLELEEPLGSFMNEYLDILATSTPDNLEDDLDTTLDVIYLLSDGGTFAALNEGGDILDCFLSKDSSGKTLFSRLSSALDKNPRMRAIASSLNNLAFSMLLENNGSDLVAEEVVANVKVGLNETLAINRADYATEQEYRVSVKSSVKQTLDENDIQLSDEELDRITEYVIVDMEGVTEVTDADMADFMSEYYEIYAGGIEE